MKKYWLAILTILSALLAQGFGAGGMTVTRVLSQNEHRIGIRVVNGIGEFFDRQTDKKFIPRGNNHISLDPMIKKGGGQVITFSMFNPSFYDHEKANQALAAMHAAGYNTARIFTESEGTDGLGGANGLNPDYMANLADFIKLASQNEIFLILTKQWLPITPRYGDIIATQCCSTFGFANAIHMAPAGIQAHQLFFQDLIKDLLKLGAPIEYILSYSISNEFYFDGNQPPLSWSAGKVTLGNGRTYDMSKAKEKLELMDDALVAMINDVRKAILQVDPTALVSMGFFAPQEPYPSRIGDPRISRTHAAIWKSEADYIDLHAYPGGELNLAQHFENYGFENMQLKPVILGEMGAFKAELFSTATAAQALVDWQVESCKFGIDGWLTWTWDDTTIGEIIPAVADGNLIGEALSPKKRPDPCAFGEDVNHNLSLGAKVRVSRQLAKQPAANAIDGLADTIWSAGFDAPQWIEINLGAPHRISEIKLLVAQYPDGNTIHTIRVHAANGKYIEVKRFTQSTHAEEWLTFNPEKSLEAVQYVRIDTTKSPSWVAWKEVQVFGE